MADDIKVNQEKKKNNVHLMPHCILPKLNSTIDLEESGI
jgi:hypothetical protein